MLSLEIFFFPLFSQKLHSVFDILRAKHGRWGGWGGGMCGSVNAIGENLHCFSRIPDGWG